MEYTEEQVRENRLKVIEALRQPGWEERKSTGNNFLWDDHGSGYWWDNGRCSEEEWRTRALAAEKTCATGLMYQTLGIAPDPRRVVNHSLAEALGDYDDDREDELWEQGIAPVLPLVWHHNDRGETWPEIADYLAEKWGLSGV